MKLIELLVQVLPKRGGWPEDALSITQDNDGSLCVWDTSDPHYDGFSWKHHTGNSLMYFWCGTEAEPLSCDHKESIVTHDQYESALAASQKPAWNGEGLPPVGCECEISFSGKSLGQCEVLFVGDSLIVWKQKSSQQEGSGYHRHMNIRPLRTESERKHEAVLESICAVLEMVAQYYKREDEAKLIYEAISAGKIPGVKLDD